MYQNHLKNSTGFLEITLLYSKSLPQMRRHFAYYRLSRQQIYIFFLLDLFSKSTGRLRHISSNKHVFLAEEKRNQVFASTPILIKFPQRLGPLHAAVQQSSNPISSHTMAHSCLTVFRSQDRRSYSKDVQKRKDCGLRENQAFFFFFCQPLMKQVFEMYEKIKSDLILIDVFKTCKSEHV